MGPEAHFVNAIQPTGPPAGMGSDVTILSDDSL